MADERQIATSGASPFDAIRHVDEQGNEYWSARELYKLLGYSSWQKFQYAIEQAQKACEQSNQKIADHSNLQVKMVPLGSGAQSILQEKNTNAPLKIVVTPRTIKPYSIS
jgi:DNA-damage-inducible protein D